MGELERKFQKKSGVTFGRILNRDLFLFLLDLEVKRSQRYQNFLCLMLLTIRPFSQEGDGDGLKVCNQALSKLLVEEIRESDIVSSFGFNQLAVFLPYADAMTGSCVRSRFEDTLKCYDFKSKGFEIMINQVCFPVHGTDATDLMEKALGGQSA